MMMTATSTTPEKLRPKAKSRACPHCGSASPRRGVSVRTGACTNKAGCDRRRLVRRRDEDRLRFRGRPWKQCHATTGATTIIFCELGVGHEGPHQRDSRQWGGDYVHPLAALLHAGTG